MLESCRGPRAPLPSRRRGPRISPADCDAGPGNSPAHRPADWRRLRDRAPRTRSTIWLARVLSVGLRSRGSVAGLNGRTIDPRRIGAQIKRLPVQEGGLRQGASTRWSEFELRRRRREAPRVLSGRHLTRASCRISARLEQIRQRRIRPRDSRWRGRDAAHRGSCRFEIDQRHRQIVARPGTSRKPAPRIGFPFRVAVRAPSRKAGRDRRGGFQRLLIEGAGCVALVAEACRADRPEMPRRRGLLGHQPAQRPQAGLDISGLLRAPCPSGSGLAAGAHCHRPTLPRTRSSPASRPPPERTSTGRREDADFAVRGASSGTTAQ